MSIQRLNVDAFIDQIVKSQVAEVSLHEHQFKLVVHDTVNSSPTWQLSHNFEFKFYKFNFNRYDDALKINFKLNSDKTMCNYLIFRTNKDYMTFVNTIENQKIFNKQMYFELMMRDEEENMQYMSLKDDNADQDEDNIDCEDFDSQIYEEHESQISDRMDFD